MITACSFLGDRSQHKSQAFPHCLCSSEACVGMLQAEWLPELKQAMEEINYKFGRSFERINCAGEVQLYEEIDPETGMQDFEKFAIHIKVRFRAEEELQLLTAHRQSGGERSVATILYLIAIQVRVTSASPDGAVQARCREVCLKLSNG